MKRRDFLRALSMAAVATGTGCLTARAAAPKGKPNILFIFADDQCFETLSMLGCEVQTPNLDRLAKSGVRFTDAYNQGAWGGAVCLASRAMLNCGRFVWNAQSNDRMKKDASEGKMWSQCMGKAGYETYFAGKWHVAAPAPEVFDYTSNIRGGMPKQVAEGYNRPKSKEDYEQGWKPWDKKHGGFWEGGKHWSEVLADDGVSFLNQAKKANKPFFMYLAFNAPHDPRQSPKEYVDRYPLSKVKVPENFLPEYPYKDKIGCPHGLRDEKLAPMPRTEYAVKVNRQEYYAIIAHMDDQIGRILDALEESGKADNTYIFFTADHGLAVGHHGLIGKQNLFEHSVRVPLMVCGPGMSKGKEISSPVYLQDIMPTIMELGGANAPDHVQFKSLLPLIKGEKKKSYDAIYGGYRNLQRMVRKDNYKMLYYPAIKKTILFDLKKDPLEVNDLSMNPKYAPVLKDLRIALKKLQEETGDTLKLEF